VGTAVAIPSEGGAIGQWVVGRAANGGATNTQ